MLLWKGSIYKQHKDDTEISMKDKSCAGKKEEGVSSHKVYRKVLAKSQPQNLDMKLPGES